MFYDTYCWTATGTVTNDGGGSGPATWYCVPELIYIYPGAPYIPSGSTTVQGAGLFGHDNVHMKSDLDIYVILNSFVAEGEIALLQSNRGAVDTITQPKATDSFGYTKATFARIDERTNNGYVQIEDKYIELANVIDNGSGSRTFVRTRARGRCHQGIARLRLR